MDDDNAYAFLEPGMVVRNPAATEWGAGQVQSRAGHRITVNFEHMGKVVVDGRVISLTPVYSPN